jgi:hypothetical protein
MQRLRHKGFAGALVLATTLVYAGFATTVAAAWGTGDRSFRTSSPTTALPFTDNHRTTPCTAKGCVEKINSTTGSATFQVQAMQTPSAGAPSATRADSGTLNQDQSSHNSLTCGGYKATDANSLQFFLGATSLGAAFYLITDTVKNTDPDRAQFCLGALYPFRTMSGNMASEAALPNGLSGFVGLLPRCAPTSATQLASNAPCVLSRMRSGSDSVLKVQVLAIGGDPWGRS